MAWEWDDWEWDEDEGDEEAVAYEDYAPDYEDSGDSVYEDSGSIYDDFFFEEPEEEERVEYEDPLRAQIEEDAGEPLLLDQPLEPDDPWAAIFGEETAKPGRKRTAAPEEDLYERLWGRDDAQDQSVAPKPAASREQAPTVPTDDRVSVWADGTPMDERKQKQARIYQIFLEEGHDEEAARVAVAQTEVEGGLLGADNMNDPGGSYGPWQLNAGGGEFLNFVPWVSEYLGRPVSFEEAKQLADDVDISTRFAARTYQGRVIKAAQARGIHGSALATYAQANAQVSINPWKAGRAYEEIFANGDPFKDAIEAKVPDKPARAAQTAKIPPGHYDGDGHDHGVATPYTQKQTDKTGQTWTIAFDYDAKYDNPFNPAIPRHRGVDLIIPDAEAKGYGKNGMGAPYEAFRNGTVVAVTQDPHGGIGIIVDTGDPKARYDRYFHNNAVLVKEGDKIVAGQTTLGQVGETGTQGFPHLHYEVSNGINGDPMGQTIDPRPYMAPPQPAQRPTTAAAPPAAAPARPAARAKPTNWMLSRDQDTPTPAPAPTTTRVDSQTPPAAPQPSARPETAAPESPALPAATQAALREWQAWRKSRGESATDVAEFRAHLGRLGAPDPWAAEEEAQRPAREKQEQFLASLPTNTRTALLEWQAMRRARGEDPANQQELEAHLDRLGAPNPWREAREAQADYDRRVAEARTRATQAPAAAPAQGGTPVPTVNGRPVTQAEYDAAVRHNEEVRRFHAAADAEQAALDRYEREYQAWDRRRDAWLNNTDMPDPGPEPQAPAAPNLTARLQGKHPTEHRAAMTLSQTRRVEEVNQRYGINTRIPDYSDAQGRPVTPPALAEAMASEARDRYGVTPNLSDYDPGKPLTPPVVAAAIEDESMVRGAQQGQLAAADIAATNENLRNTRLLELARANELQETGQVAASPVTVDPLGPQPARVNERIRQYYLDRGYSEEDALREATLTPATSGFIQPEPIKPRPARESQQIAQQQVADNTYPAERTTLERLGDSVMRSTYDFLDQVLVSAPNFISQANRALPDFVPGQPWRSPAAREAMALQTQEWTNRFRNEIEGMRAEAQASGIPLVRPPGHQTQWADPTTYAEMFIEGLPVLTAAIGAGMAGGAVAGPVGALAASSTVMFGLEGGDAYDTALEHGLDRDTALALGVTVGGVNAAIENAPILGWVGRAASPVIQSRAAQRLANTAAGEMTQTALSRVDNGAFRAVYNAGQQGFQEGSEEVIQGLVSNLAERTYNADKDLTEGLLEGFVGGLLPGAVLGSTQQVVSRFSTPSAAPATVADITLRDSVRVTPASPDWQSFRVEAPGLDAVLTVDPVSRAVTTGVLDDAARGRPARVDTAEDRDLAIRNVGTVFNHLTDQGILSPENNTEGMETFRRAATDAVTMVREGAVRVERASLAPPAGSVAETADYTPGTPTDARVDLPAAEIGWSGDINIPGAMVKMVVRGDANPQVAPSLVGQESVRVLGNAAATLETRLTARMRTAALLDPGQDRAFNLAWSGGSFDGLNHGQNATSPTSVQTTRADAISLDLGQTVFSAVAKAESKGIDARTDPRAVPIITNHIVATVVHEVAHDLFNKQGSHTKQHYDAITSLAALVQTERAALEPIVQDLWERGEIRNLLVAQGTALQQSSPSAFWKGHGANLAQRYRAAPTRPGSRPGPVGGTVPPSDGGRRPGSVSGVPDGRGVNRAAAGVSLGPPEGGVTRAPVPTRVGAPDTRAAERVAAVTRGRTAGLAEVTAFHADPRGDSLQATLTLPDAQTARAVAGRIAPSGYAVEMRGREGEERVDLVVTSVTEPAAAAMGRIEAFVDRLESRGLSVDPRYQRGSPEVIRAAEYDAILHAGPAATVQPESIGPPNVRYILNAAQRAAREANWQRVNRQARQPLGANLPRLRRGRQRPQARPVVPMDLPPFPEPAPIVRADTRGPSPAPIDPRTTLPRQAVAPRSGVAVIDPIQGVVLIENGEPPPYSNEDAIRDGWLGIPPPGGRIGTGSDLLNRLVDTPFLSQADLVALLGERPADLDQVVQFMLDQRQKVIAGELQPSDVAKAYFLTVASQGQGAINPEIVTRKTGMPIPEHFLTARPAGGWQVRPEDAMAAWLASPTGQTALADLNDGVFNDEAWRQGAAIRAAFSDNRIMNLGVLGNTANTRGFMTMRDVPALTARLNAARGDPRVLANSVGNLAGIGPRKTGFMQHLLGFGGVPTVDVRAINTWITGSGDIRGLETEAAQVARAINEHMGAGGSAATALVLARIAVGYNQLRRSGFAPDIPRPVYNAIMHGWLWSKVKGIPHMNAPIYGVQAAPVVRPEFVPFLPRPQTGYVAQNGRLEHQEAPTGYKAVNGRLEYQGGDPSVYTFEDGLLVARPEPQIPTIPPSVPDVTDLTGIGLDPLDPRRGGLAVPRVNYAPDSPEDIIENTFQIAAMRQRTNRPSISAEEMGALTPQMPDPDAPTGVQARDKDGNLKFDKKGKPVIEQTWHGKPHALDDMRLAVEVGLPHRRWYRDFGNWAKDLVGEPNLHEFRVLFGITSSRTPVNVNLINTLNAMWIARTMPEDRLGDENAWETMRQSLRYTAPDKDNPQQPKIDPKTKAPQQNKVAWTGQMTTKMVSGYTTGTVLNSSNAKTASYSGNVLAGSLAVYDPNTTIDTWMGQLIGWSTDRFANDDAAYRSGHAIFNWLAREQGITPHEAQAAGWFTIKTISERAKDIRARLDLHPSDPNALTLGEAIREAQSRNLFESVKGDLADVVRQPGVKEAVARLKSVIDKTRPGPKSAGHMNMIYPGDLPKTIPYGRRPISNETVEEGRLAATLQSPTVNIQANADLAGVENGGLPYVHVPHHVVMTATGFSVTLPGGNFDTARYVASLIGQRTNLPEIAVHNVSSRAPNIAGFRFYVNDEAMDSEVMSSLTDTLAQQDVSFVVGPIGEYVLVPLAGLPERVQPDTVVKSIRDLGLEELNVEGYRGDVEAITANDYAGTVERLGRVYGPTGQQGLQEPAVTDGDSATVPEPRPAAPTLPEGWRTGVDPEEFLAIRSRNTRGGFLSPLDAEGLAGKDVYLWGTEDTGFAGFVLSPEGDVQNVINVPGQNGAQTKGVGVEAMLLSIERGGITLDAFDGFLPDYYHQFGFEEMGRIPFDRDYAPPNWNYERDGEPDVVLMARADFLNGETPDDVRTRIRAKNFIERERAPVFTDWDDAAGVRERWLSERGIVPGVGREEVREGVRGAESGVAPGPGTADGGDLARPSTPFLPQERDENLIRRAIGEFGLTRDPSEAFYVLPDGRMLAKPPPPPRQFGYPMDAFAEHSSIERAYDGPGRDRVTRAANADPNREGVAYVGDFLARTGAIRWSLGPRNLLIEAAGPLTRQQQSRALAEAAHVDRVAFDRPGATRRSYDPQIDRVEMARAIRGLDQARPSAPILPSGEFRASMTRTDVDENQIVADNRQTIIEQYSGDMAEIIVKEVIQNSVDASRETGGTTTVAIFPSQRMIWVDDHGTGMSAATVANEFTRYKGSKKSAGASGGKGTAKSAILGRAQKIEVRTVARVGNAVPEIVQGARVVALNDTTGEVVIRDNRSMEPRYRKLIPPDERRALLGDQIDDALLAQPPNNGYRILSADVLDAAIATAESTGGTYEETIVWGTADDYLRPSVGLRGQSGPLGWVDDAIRNGTLPPNSLTEPLLTRPWENAYTDIELEGGVTVYGQEGVPYTGTRISTIVEPSANWSMPTGNEYRRSPLERWLDDFVASNRIPNQKIDFIVDGVDYQPVSPEVDPPNTLMKTIEGDTWDIDIYASEGLKEDTGISVRAQNNGLFQTSIWVRLPSAARIPRAITANIRAKVGSKEPGYPWSADRMRLIAGSEEAINEYIVNDVFREVRQRESEALSNAIRGGLVIPGTSDMRLFNTGSVEGNTLAELEDLRHRPYLSTLGNGMSDLHARLSELLDGRSWGFYEGGSFRKSAIGGFGVSSDWLGLNVGLADLRTQYPGMDFVLLYDPWAILQTAVSSARDLDIPVFEQDDTQQPVRRARRARRDQPKLTPLSEALAKWNPNKPLDVKIAGYDEHLSPSYMPQEARYAEDALRRIRQDDPTNTSMIEWYSERVRDFQKVERDYLRRLSNHIVARAILHGEEPPMIDPTNPSVKPRNLKEDDSYFPAFWEPSTGDIFTRMREMEMDLEAFDPDQHSNPDSERTYRQRQIDRYRAALAFNEQIEEAVALHQEARGEGGVLMVLGNVYSLDQEGVDNAFANTQTELRRYTDYYDKMEEGYTKRSAMIRVWLADRTLERLERLTGLTGRAAQEPSSFSSKFAPLADLADQARGKTFGSRFLDLLADYYLSISQHEFTHNAVREHERAAFSRYLSEVVAFAGDRQTRAIARDFVQQMADNGQLRAMLSDYDQYIRIKNSENVFQKIGVEARADDIPVPEYIDIGPPVGGAPARPDEGGGDTGPRPGTAGVPGDRGETRSVTREALRAGDQRSPQLAEESGALPGGAGRYGPRLYARQYGDPDIREQAQDAADRFADLIEEEVGVPPEHADRYAEIAAALAANDAQALGNLGLTPDEARQRMAGVIGHLQVSSPEEAATLLGEIAETWGAYDESRRSPVRGTPSANPQAQTPVAPPEQWVDPFYSNLQRIAADLPDVVRAEAERTIKGREIPGRIVRTAAQAKGQQPPKDRPITVDAEGNWVIASRREADRVTPARAAGTQVLAYLENNGAKPDELEWTGLRDWLQGQEGQVTRQDVLDYLDQNQVRIEEVVLEGGLPEVTPDDVAVSFDGEDEVLTSNDPNAPSATVRYHNARAGALDRNYEALQDENGDWHIKRDGEANAFAMTTDADNIDYYIRDDMVEIARYEREEAESSVTTKYGQYTLPGGEGYRELLITAPERPYVQPDVPALTRAEADELGVLGQKMRRRGNLPPEEMARWRQLQDKKTVHQDAVTALSAANKSREPYKSSHWEQPNILVHTRFNERTDADGKRVLFIEEIQSDWHQRGRKAGYKSARPGPGMRPLREIEADLQRMLDANPDMDANEVYQSNEEYRRVRNELDEAVRSERRTSGEVPDAPFKQTEQWAGLAFKRIVRWAAERGFDRVGWTTGDQQNERYPSLAQTISEVAYSGTNLRAYDHNGTEVVNRTGVSQSDLSDYLGDELAERLMTQQPQGTLRRLTDLNVTVGGEGMKGFYDRILPTIANNLGKAFGAKAGITKVSTGGASTVYDLISSTGHVYTTVESEAEGERFMGLRDQSSPSGTYGENGWTLVPRRVSTENEVHALDIPPAMSRSVLLTGQPLFQAPEIPPWDDPNYPDRLDPYEEVDPEWVAALNDYEAEQDIENPDRTPRTDSPAQILEVAAEIEERLIGPVDPVRFDETQFPEWARKVMALGAVMPSLEEDPSPAASDIQAAIMNGPNAATLSAAEIDALRGTILFQYNRLMRRAARADEATLTPPRAAEIIDEARRYTALMALATLPRTQWGTLTPVWNSAPVSEGQGATLADFMAEQRSLREAGRESEARALGVQRAANLLQGARPTMRRRQPVQQGQAVVKAAAAIGQTTHAGLTPTKVATTIASPSDLSISPTEFVLAARYNAMLLGPRGILVDYLGNAGMAFFKMFTDPFLPSQGGFNLRARAEITRAEYVAMATALPLMWKNVSDTILNGVTEAQAAATATPRTMSGRISERISNRIADLGMQAASPARQAMSRDPELLALRAAKVGVIGTAEVAGRLKSVADVSINALGYGMEQSRQAGILAWKEGLDPSSPRFRIRTLEILDGINVHPDPATARVMMDEMDANSRREAQRITFQGPMGTIGTGMERIQQNPFGQFVLPFLRALYHIRGWAIDLSPLGAVGTLVDVARAQVPPSNKYVKLIDRPITMATGIGAGGYVGGAIGAGLAGPVGMVAGGALGAEIGRRMTRNTGFAGGPYQHAYSGAQVGAGVADLDRRALANVVGTSAFFWMLGMAFEGLISASGPPDDPIPLYDEDKPDFEAQKLRATMEASGWQRYSIKIGDRWYPYSNWGPLGYLLAAAGAIGEAHRYGLPADREKTARSDWRVVGGAQGLYDLITQGDASTTRTASRRFFGVVRDMSYIQGLLELYEVGKAVSVIYGPAPAYPEGADQREKKRLDSDQKKKVRDAKARITEWAGRTATSLVPVSALASTIAGAQDPYARADDYGSIRQQIAARVPEEGPFPEIGPPGSFIPDLVADPLGSPTGRRQGLPIKVDVLGRQARNPFEGWSALNPIRSSQEDLSRPTVNALLEAGVGAPTVGTELIYRPLTGKADDRGRVSTESRKPDLILVQITPRMRMELQGIIGQRVDARVQELLAEVPQEAREADPQAWRDRLAEEMKGIDSAAKREYSEDAVNSVLLFEPLVQDADRVRPFVAKAKPEEEEAAPEEPPIDIGPPPLDENGEPLPTVEPTATNTPTPRATRTPNPLAPTATPRLQDIRATQQAAGEPTATPRPRAGSTPRATSTPRPVAPTRTPRPGGTPTDPLIDTIRRRNGL
jgi:murein DD-endopeptidase MepM/ murein hydrolase activator NlpD